MRDEGCQPVRLVFGSAFALRNLGAHCVQLFSGFLNDNCEKINASSP
jgi:hypothetical protein